MGPYVRRAFTVVVRDSLLRLTRVFAAAALLGLLAGITACLPLEVEVEGERAEFGACPEAFCSEATPQGLIFVGVGFWDDDRLRLGPITPEGTIRVGLRLPDMGELPPLRVEVEDNAAVRIGEVTDDVNLYSGVPMKRVELVGCFEGEVVVRVVEAETGYLMDRLRLTVDPVGELTVVKVDGADDGALVAGESQLIGVRILSHGGFGRIVDQALSLTAVGYPTQPENMYWDCFSFTPEPGTDSVTFEARSGGQVVQKTFRVVEPSW
ncbi:MAG: hypothetical protein H6700_12065 [Myxococcales bacterium]|nr:hypothetical protein [Myxococcales bacterium]